jgi:hypothetical protein
MIWYLTKGNHKWSIHPLVRAWLRAGGLTRFVVVAGVSVLLSLAASPVFAVIAQIFGRGEFSQFIRGLPRILVWGAWILWVIDAYMDKRTTRGDLKKLLVSPNVVLATRGEYIGGHPQLPHGRFVYLTLGGVMENPLLNIVLPRAGGIPDDTFAMPILDLQKTTQSVAKTGDEATVNLTLASVTFRAKLLGEQATLKVEYIAQAGRKQTVEITRFLFGNGEIQTWHNYVICIQAEADTGQPPYGPWKSLPRGAPPVRGTTGVNPPVDNTPPGTPPASTPPPGELPTANLPASRWKRLT